MKLYIISVITAKLTPTDKMSLVEDNMEYPPKRPKAIPNSQARKNILWLLPLWQCLLNFIKNNKKREPIIPRPKPVKTGAMRYAIESGWNKSNKNADEMAINPLIASLLSSALTKTNRSANKAKRNPTISIP